MRRLSLAALCWQVLVPGNHTRSWGPKNMSAIGHTAEPEIERAHLSAPNFAKIMLRKAWLRQRIARTASVAHPLAFVVALCFLASVVPAQATEPQDMSYWISMRGITEDGQPSFVTLSYVQTATHTVAFVGCRGRTWYLQSGAAATVQAARSSGETVQIHRGAPGSSPQSSTVICLIQADR